MPLPLEQQPTTEYRETSCIQNITLYNSVSVYGIFVEKSSLFPKSSSKLKQAPSPGCIIAEKKKELELNFDGLRPLEA